MSESQERDSALPQRLEELDRQIVREVRQLVEDVQREIAGRLRQGSQEMLRLVDEVVPRLPETFRHRLAEIGSAREAAAKPGGDELLEALGRIDVEPSQSDLLNALLEESRRFASRVAFFLTREGEARCWSSQGFARSAQTLADLTVDYADGAWRRFAAGRGVVRLDEAERSGFAERLGAVAASDAVLVPFVLRGHLGGALYADRTEGEVDVASLQVVTYAASQALETLALRAGVASPTLRAGDGDGTGVPLWRGDAAAAPAAPPAVAEPAEEASVEEPRAEEPQLEEPTGEEPSFEEPSFEEPSAPAAEEAPPAAEPVHGDELAAVAFAEPTSEEPVAAEPAAEEAPTAEEAPEPTVTAAEDEVAGSGFETAPELDEETEEADSIEPPELEPPRLDADEDIFAAESEADIFATAEEETLDETPLDEAPLEEELLEETDDDLWELEEAEEPSLAADVAAETPEPPETPDLAPYGGAADRETSAPEVTEPIPTQQPAAGEPAAGDLDEAEPSETPTLEVPTVGQQTVRLDVSSLRGQGLATPPAPAFEPPPSPTVEPPTGAEEGEEAPDAFDDYELEPEPAIGGEPSAEEADEAAARTAPLPTIPAEPEEPAAPEPAAPAPPSEGATMMVSRDEIGVAATPPPPTFTQPVTPPPAAPPPAPAPPPAAEPEERAGSSEVKPPEDVQGPGLAFRRQEEAIDASVPEGEAALHEEARRLARLLVSEIKLYNEELIEVGRRDGNIYERLKEDIDRSRQMYEERIDPRVSESGQDYFRQEMVQRLAGGDAAVLGV